jgi:hypothetical protein
LLSAAEITGVTRVLLSGSQSQKGEIVTGNKLRTFV